MQHGFLMQTDLKGRVDDLSFKPKQQIFLPLFEAVANSLQSIVLSNRSDGRIDITLERDDAQTNLRVADNSIAAIKNITVTDNGIGFNHENFAAFDLLNTRAKKIQFGCKGVGRLFWLKTFEKVEVNSVFLDGSKAKRRKLVFTLDWPENSNQELHEDTAKIQTSIKLKELKSKYKEHFRKKLTTLKQELLKHFLSNLILLNDKCPVITIRDGENIETINQSLLPTCEMETFTIGNQEFQIRHIKTSLMDDDKHCLYFCAGNRVVKSEKVENFTKKKIDGNFYYSGYITSQYFDDTVNTERSDFSIEDDKEGLFGEIDWVDINTAVNKRLLTYLSAYYQFLEKEKEDTLRDVFEHDLPYLKYLEKENKRDIDNIGYDTSKEKVKEELGLIHFKNQARASSSISKLLTQIEAKDITNFEDFEQQHRDELRKFSTVNEANLASYILYRKTVLNIFSQAISKLSDKEYEYEKTIHSLIFPRMIDSNQHEEDYNHHNLWILDDRFSFYDYVASDMPLTQHKVLDSESDGRPDVALYYNLSFTPDIEDEIQTVVLIELKRPGRANYKENPYDQLLRYIAAIRNNEEKDHNGGQILVGPSTRYYGYIICDTDNEKIKEFIEKDDFKPTPDGKGFFKPHTGYNAYIEIIPFKKLLVDAKKRNEVFFKKVISNFS